MTYSSERSRMNTDRSSLARDPGTSPHSPHVGTNGVRPAADVSSAAASQPAGEGASAAARQRDWSLEERIPSCVDTARRILDAILEQLQAANWDASDLFAVRLALEEGLINAIKHGNRYDRNKSVQVQCLATSGYLHIEIEDE